MIPAEIIKKVKMLELRTRKLVEEVVGERYQSAFRGRGISFEEVREYQPGDDVRTIDWNVTARMNHPYVKQFREERQLTLFLLVDLSGSGLFGSVNQTKREVAAEIASVLAFSALMNQDKVGLALFTDRVEKFVPPNKSRTHVLRVICDILTYQPRQRGTDLTGALRFVCRTLTKRSIVVVLTDLMGQTNPSRQDIEAHLRRQAIMSQTLIQTPLSALRQAQHRHDVVVIQILDRYELELPALGRLVLKDAETGEVVEVNTGDPRRRLFFKQRQERAQGEIRELFRAAGIDLIQIRTDQDYVKPLAQFFEARERRRHHAV